MAATIKPESLINKGIEVIEILEYQSIMTPKRGDYDTTLSLTWCYNYDTIYKKGE